VRYQHVCKNLTKVWPPHLGEYQRSSYSLISLKSCAKKLKLGLAKVSMLSKDFIHQGFTYTQSSICGTLKGHVRGRGRHHSNHCAGIRMLQKYYVTYFLPTVYKYMYISDKEEKKNLAFFLFLSSSRKFC
jgi:hypothetical protein